MAIRFTDATPALKLTPLPADGQAPHLNPGEVDVWITAEVDRDVKAHLRTRDVEQGGLLVGRAFCDPQTGTLAHVRITACAPAVDSQGTGFSLRLGAASSSVAFFRTMGGAVAVAVFGALMSSHLARQLAESTRARGGDPPAL